MSENYKNSLKATALFGGVEMYTILISVIKNKFIAVLLSTEGVGISGLFTQTTGMISSLTNFGLQNSAVRDVAAANASGNNYEVSKTIIVLRRIIWITGFLGTIITAVLSTWLSKLVFGSDKYAIAFLLLSVTLLLNQISSGQNVLVQGLRKYNYLAKSNVLGQTIGLLISVPLYYIWRKDAIVPVLIISSVISLLLSFFFSRKIPIEKIRIDKHTTINIGIDMAKLGLAMNFSGIVTLTMAYVLRLFISNKGGVDEVGLYVAGSAISETYVGLVFAAMGTDYYPRLVEVIEDKVKTKNLVFDQVMIGLLLIFPIQIAFIIFSPLVIKILLSAKFLSLVFFLKTAILGMLFKICSWTLTYVIIANKDSKLLIISSIIFGVFMLVINLLFYSFRGIDGLGISYVITNFCYLLWIGFLVYFRYKLRLSQEILKYLGSIAVVVFSCYFISIYCDYNIATTIGLCFLLLLSSAFTLYQLEKRSGLITIFTNKIRKR
ncbi:MAG: oligosaccharide flippase family protein [Candidatus Azobacteroides sp.]|nr:oligosaccharide flippase family protein [Candidatus Azobacteroides sp.]